MVSFIYFMFIIDNFRYSHRAERVNEKTFNIRY